LIAVLVLLIAALSTAYRLRRNKEAMILRPALAVAILLVATFALGGCAGSVQTTLNPGNGSTNSGTSSYTVTITASGSGAPTHTQQFALTVSQ
jgi:ABC-type glycerol-3-phosphate transport system substrate-binding protein